MNERKNAYSGNTRNVRKKKKRGVLFAPLSFIIICAVIVLGMSVFFRVSKVEVVGAVKYSDAEILEASGIGIGDNLFFLNRFTALSRIKSKLPYISEAKITRSLPNKVIIDVSESIMLAYVRFNGELWAVDSGCKVLEAVGQSRAEGLIEITGVEVGSPIKGGKLTGDGAEASKITYLAEILSGIQSREMQSSINNINLGNLANPSFDYLDRFTVKLGKMEDTEYKLNLLNRAIEKMEPGDAGTIDLSMSADRKAHYSPG
jgi:cell division protein FtsQ